MVSVELAKELIVQNTTALDSKNISIGEAIGYIVSEDIFSPVNLPGFNQAAMDGYGVQYDDLSERISNFKIVAEIAAGDNYNKLINRKEAVRIFTGAKIPENVDCIFVQEESQVSDDGCSVSFIGNGCKPGENIRIKGVQIKSGDIAIKKGTLINPAAVGFLASIGIPELEVTRKPKVAIIVTGSELQRPGYNLDEGNVYESNSYMLKAALQDLNIDEIKVFYARDDSKSILKIFNHVLEEADLIMFSGGISVGKFDFVGSVLKESAVKEIFYKVKQKPGKPLFYGKHNNTGVFALPGNPAAALTCFYEYVYPSIKIMSGRKDIFLNSIKLPLLTDYTKKTGLSNFIKGKISNGCVEILAGQESNILSSFAESNCLVFLHEEDQAVYAGDLVDVHLLP